MPLERKRRAIFFVFIAIQAFHSQALDQRCQAKWNATDPYPLCMNSSTSIWCDRSTYSKIPRANSHEPNFNERQARDATKFNISNSCLVDIQREDLVGYKSIKIFDASNNFVTILRSMAFSANQKLEKINLRGNEIRELQTKAFVGLIHLQYLDLSNNKIRRIPKRIWRRLSELKTLILDKNKLALVSDYYFISLTSLMVLHMRGNSIEHIDPFSFSHGKLTELLLDNNNITKIDEDTFSGIPSLTCLSLSSNEIRVWPEDYGKTLKKLQNLNLGSNHIAEFTVQHVKLLTDLTHLALDNNNLKIINKNLFTTTIELKFLNLSKNYIETIPEDAFASLKQVETILLRKNELSTPYATWFENLGKKENATVDLKNNQWQCDCSIIKFQNYVNAMQQRQSTLAKKLCITCSSPKLMEGRSLDNDNMKEIEHDLKCVLVNDSTSLSPTTKPLFIAASTSETTRITSARKTDHRTTMENMTTSASIKVDIDPKESMETYDPGDESGNKKLFIALVIALVATIVIGFGLVHLYCKRSRCRVSKISKTRLDSTNSNKPMLEEEPDLPILNDLTEPFEPHTRRGREETIPMTSNLHRSYSEFNNRKRMEREQYHTPNTVPKQLYTHGEEDSHGNTSLKQNVLKSGIPRQHSNDSFRSCQDFSGNYDPAFFSISDNQENIFEDGPPSSFASYSIGSRKCGDGAEAHISS